jgi:hypothetical protein
MSLHLLPLTSTQSASFNDDRITRSSFLLPSLVPPSLFQILSTPQGPAFPSPFRFVCRTSGGQRLVVRRR